MTLKTRRPTGKAPWPMILLAGREKTGKSYAAAAFSASDMIDRTFYLEIGEGSADQYGAIPGARYEIVEHDGSHAGILGAIQDVKAEPTNGRPHAIVVDSMSELWGLLCDEQQTIANERRKRTITMDQWNAAKKRWRKIIDELRGHKGPVILTARYEQVTIMKDGQPTAEKEWKVRAEKDLPFEVDGLITLTEPRRPFVAGMRTVAINIPAGGLAPKNPEGFNLDAFFRSLNIEGGDRAYIPRKEDPGAYSPADEAIRPDELDDLPEDLLGGTDPERAA